MAISFGFRALFLMAFLMNLLTPARAYKHAHRPPKYRVDTVNVLNLEESRELVFDHCNRGSVDQIHTYSRTDGIIDTRGFELFTESSVGFSATVGALDTVGAQLGLSASHTIRKTVKHSRQTSSEVTQGLTTTIPAGKCVKMEQSVASVTLEKRRVCAEHCRDLHKPMMRQRTMRVLLPATMLSERSASGSEL